MARRALSLLGWHMAFALRRLGWEPLAAVLLLVAAVALAWQADALAQKSEQLQSALAERTRKFAPVDFQERESLAQQIESLLGELPADDALADRVKRLFAVAGEHDLQLEQGDYAVIPDPKAGVLRYQITLPVRGANDQVQAFVLDALAAMPLLGLEGIAFRRDTAASSELEARIRFFVLARQP